MEERLFGAFQGCDRWELFKDAIASKKLNNYLILAQLLVLLTRGDVLKTTDRCGFDRTSFIGEDLIVTEVEPSQVGER